MEAKQLKHLLEIPLEVDRSVFLPIVEVTSNKYMFKTKDCYFQLYEALEEWVEINKRTSEKKYNEMIEDKITCYTSSSPPIPINDRKFQSEIPNEDLSIYSKLIKKQFKPMHVTSSEKDWTQSTNKKSVTTMVNGQQTPQKSVTTMVNGQQTPQKSVTTMVNGPQTPQKSFKIAQTFDIRKSQSRGPSPMKLSRDSGNVIRTSRDFLLNKSKELTQSRDIPEKQNTETLNSSSKELPQIARDLCNILNNNNLKTEIRRNTDQIKIIGITANGPSDRLITMNRRNTEPNSQTPSQHQAQVNVKRSTTKVEPQHESGDFQELLDIIYQDPENQPQIDDKPNDGILAKSEIDKSSNDTNSKSTKHYQFTAGEGKLKQWTINDKSIDLLKIYDEPHAGVINSITITKDNKFLFTSDDIGYQKQWSIQQRSLLKHYGKIHIEGIDSMITTNDSLNLFTGGLREQKQWSIPNKKLIKDYGRAHDSYILSMAVTYDNKFLFTGADDQNQKQWCIETQQMVKNYGIVHNSLIRCIVVTLDNRCMFTGGYDNHLKKWSIKKQELDKDLGGTIGKGLEDSILSMCIGNGGKSLFSCSYDGFLKEWSILKGELVKDWGQVHQFDNIKKIVMSVDGEMLFTMGCSGYMKMWKVANGDLVRDFGQVDDSADVFMNLLY